MSWLTCSGRENSLEPQQNSANERESAPWSLPTDHMRMPGSLKIESGVGERLGMSDQLKFG
jgi:hypothetical protein